MPSVVVSQLWGGRGRTTQFHLTGQPQHRFQAGRELLGVENTPTDTSASLPSQLQQYGPPNPQALGFLQPGVELG